MLTSFVLVFLLTLLFSKFPLGSKAVVFLEKKIRNFLWKRGDRNSGGRNLDNWKVRPAD